MNNNLVVDGEASETDSDDEAVEQMLRSTIEQVGLQFF